LKRNALIRVFLILILFMGMFMISPASAVKAAPCAGAVMVLNTNDSGAGSLRQAIADACDGSQITFDSSLAGQTISLTTGELVIDKILMVGVPDLNSNSHVTVSGSHLSRVFHIAETPTSEA